MGATCEIRGVSVFALGDFNPSIFSPAWLVANKLIMLSEAEAANISVANKDVMLFELEWLKIQISRESFHAETMSESHEGLLRDLVLGVFRLLSHTPIHKLGINMQLHYRVDTIDRWHEIGHLLAPKKIWEDILGKPGLASIVMQDDARGNGYRGFTRVQVEPSQKIKPGLFMLINDHYEVDPQVTSTGADLLLGVVGEQYEWSLKRGEEICKKLMEATYELTSRK